MYIYMSKVSYLILSYLILDGITPSNTNNLCTLTVKKILYKDTLKKAASSLLGTTCLRSGLYSGKGD